VTAEGAGVSERERLLDLINATVKDDPYEGWNVREWDPKNPRDLDEQITDAILAAGFGDVARTVSSVAEMDALPVGSIVKGAADGEVVVGRKPHGNNFPNAVNGFWEVVGSELGTDAESILWDGPALVLYVPSTTNTNGDSQ